MHAIVSLYYCHDRFTYGPINIFLFFLTGHCKELKNFNSMFAIISGLGHGSVSRLRSTWDKLPGKYSKLFEVCYDQIDFQVLAAVEY